MTMSNLTSLYLSFPIYRGQTIIAPPLTELQWLLKQLTFVAHLEHYLAYLIYLMYINYFYSHITAGYAEAQSG